MLGPKYVEPEIELSSKFNQAPKKKVGQLADLKKWWTQFEDPILNSLIEEAIEENYDLKIACERIAEVRARYRLASAQLWPEIDLNVSAQRQRVSQALFLSPFEGPSVQNLFLFDFDASWEIDFFGKLRRLKEVGYFELEASRENMRDLYLTLLAEVTKEYASFRSLQKRIDLTFEQIRIANELLNFAKARYQAGLRSEIEPKEVSSELNALKAALLPLQNRLNETLFNLATLLGKQPEKIPKHWFEEKPIPVAVHKIPIGIPSDLLRRRADIRKQERLIRASNSQIGAAIALLFPSFSLTSSYGFSSDDASNWFSSEARNYSVAPNALLPLIDFGRIRAEIDFSKAAHRKALLDYEKTVLEALQEVEQSLSAYFHEQARLLEIEKQVKDLSRTRDLMRMKYDAGLVSLSKVLDAEQRLLFTQQSSLSSQQTLSKNLMKVYKSLGGDWDCSNTL